MVSQRENKDKREPLYLANGDVHFTVTVKIRVCEGILRNQKQTSYVIYQNLREKH